MPDHYVSTHFEPGPFSSTGFGHRERHPHPALALSPDEPGNLVIKRDLVVVSEASELVSGAN